MIETRFKKTEIGEIPEEWDSMQLEEISILITDGSHNSPKESPIGYYMPSVKDMNTNGFNFSGCKIIGESDYLLLKRQGCQPLVGDVLIAKDGSMLKYCFTIKHYMPIVILSSIAIIRPIQEVNPSYLAYYFKQNNIVNYAINNFKTGTGVPRIVLKNFAKIPVSIPAIDEQQRIATALSDIDTLLSTLTKKIEKKKLIKQGAMQQLLTGKKRLAGFTEPWEERVVGDTFKLIGNNTFSREQLSNIGIVSNIHYGDVLIKFHSIIDLRKVVLPKIKIEHRLTARNALSCGDIIMADTAEDNIVGKACEVYGMTSELVEAGLHTIVLRPLIQFAPMFLGYYLNSTSYHDKLIPHIQGIKVSSISKAALLSTIIFVPTDIAEQSAIATILSDMDKEIEALEAKRTKYTQVKQGMMQQLLTGKIRLID